MKLFISLILIVFIAILPDPGICSPADYETTPGLSCAINSEIPDTAVRNAETEGKIGKIFAAAGMTGSIFIANPATRESFGYQPELWDSGYLPASTFKIPNTLIGLETGVIDTAYIFRWDGQKQRMAEWEKDLTLKQAYDVSCVPCYQEVARKIGVERMVSFLKLFRYGRMEVNKDNIDLFWLRGNSRITLREQVSFLQRLNEEKLQLSSFTMSVMKQIMLNEKTDRYTIRGKTGWAIREGNNYGWFVGWIETRESTWYFATLVIPENQQQISDFAIARKVITKEVLNVFGILEID